MSEERCGFCGMPAHEYGQSGCINVLLDARDSLRSVLDGLISAAEKVKDVPARIISADGYEQALDEAWGALQAAVVEARRVMEEGS